MEGEKRGTSQMTYFFFTTLKKEFPKYIKLMIIYYDLPQIIQCFFQIHQEAPSFLDTSLCPIKNLPFLSSDLIQMEQFKLKPFNLTIWNE